MASLQFLPLKASHLYANTTTPHNSSTSQFFLNRENRKHVFKKSLACRAAKDNTNDQENANDSFKNVGGKFDRRDILLGLGGLYGTTAVSQAAFASPVDATKCGNADTLPTCTNIKDANCCPPPNPNISDFIFPTNQPLRVRPAAQLADKKYIEKYNKAMQIMRSLPKDHPHSFAQQAAIHCAYCDSAYEMVGFPNVKMDVHFSWLFFPFHRWYLYFYEKILGKLIGDPTFAIPYWNWDSPDGMPIPDMFADRSSPLYDKLRDDNHQPPLKIDLNYSKSNPSPVGNELIEANYRVMYTQMVSSSKTPELFFGGAYRGGEPQVKAAGALENQPHTQLHIWTGDPEQKYGEDMGRFFSAGRDPLFYSHHANVDRMWNIWKTLPGKNRKDIEDPDWLDSAFLFYDENEKLVRVKIRDCVDTKKMGYVYQDVPLPWLGARKPPKKGKGKGLGKKSGVANAAEMPQVFPNANQVFPKVLDGLLKVTIPRPKKSRSQEEKEDEEEILVIDGIEYDGDEYIKFDVFLNDEDEVESGPNNAEFAGSYSNVPSKSNNRVKVSMSLGITELLEDVGADDDDNIVVALVPRTGKGKVTIGGAKIIISS
ncbi:polyphenol oxidase, chloroplastic-like [Apium graveolens]|uniref:polyphenol oxidase, chloroplastic-like n=1 Tax=Apium graveolens TaxID=4045 RepID=UPI003D7B8270